MADFNLYLPLLLSFEGGYVNDPADPGGATNKGVTLATFRNAAKLFAGLDPTLANLKQLTDVQVGIVYKHLYWDKLQADLLPSQHLAEIYADFYVNAGSNAVKLMQKVLNGLRAQGPLDVDGVPGTATTCALLSADQLEVYRRYREGRAQYYRDLAAARPSLGKFLKGWLNRVDRFPEL